MPTHDTQGKQSRWPEWLTWAITLGWILLVAVLMLLLSDEYDPSYRFDIKDWESAATIASGVFSPIAVLWVVRSFYVQKQELKAAVDAAVAQARALSNQNELMKEQHDREIAASVLWSLRPYIGVQAGRSTPTMTLSIGAQNVGLGAAHLLHATVYVRDRDLEVTQQEVPIAASLLASATVEPVVVPWNFKSFEDAATHLYVSLHYSDASGRQRVDYYAIRREGRNAFHTRRALNELDFGAMLEDAELF